MTAPAQPKIWSCLRCNANWAGRWNKVFRDFPQPVRCPRCSSPYWNKPRTRLSSAFKKSALDAFKEGAKERVDIEYIKDPSKYGKDVE